MRRDEWFESFGQFPEFRACRSEPGESPKADDDLAD